MKNTAKENFEGWPAQLSKMIDNQKYEVINFGVCGKTMQKSKEGSEKDSYWDSSAFKEA